MLKATLRRGEIVPLETLPQDWTDGTQLEIEIAKGENHDPSLDIDEWAMVMNSLCMDSAADDEVMMRQAIEEHREQAKAQARREMGLTK